MVDGGIYGCVGVREIFIAMDESHMFLELIVSLFCVCTWVCMRACVCVYIHMHVWMMGWLDPDADY